MIINKTEIKNLEPIKTIAIHNIGDYSGIASAFMKLAEWAEKNNYWAKAPKMMGVYHDNPSQVSVEKLRSHACLEKIENVNLGEGMEFYEISGGKYFVTTAEVKMSEYADAWNKVYASVSEKGLTCDMRDHYELYLSCVDNTQGENAPWIVEFCIPVK